MKFKLRKFKKGDEESLQQNINDKDIAKYTLNIPCPYTKKDAKLWIKRNIKLNKLKNPEAIIFVIDVNGEVAGSINLSNIDRINKNAEIGFWLGSKYRNKGIMKKAIQELIKIGFNKLKLIRIYAYVFAFNKKSQKLLGKKGFKLEGRLRKNSVKNGRHYDDFVYAKTI